MENQNIPGPEWVQLLFILFKTPVTEREISSFRGAVIHSLQNNSLLFHNHDGEGFRYAYPLIQYKSIKGNAALVCINQGAKDVNDFFDSNTSVLNLRNHKVELKIDEVMPIVHHVHISEQMIPYRLKKWIPLNSDNYEEYRKLDSMVERIYFLEKVLTGNILSFAKGVGVRFAEQVKCTITDISSTYQTKVKRVPMQCFDIHFKSNVSLPNFIGLGKHASINFGVVTQEGIKTTVEKTD